MKTYEMLTNPLGEETLKRVEGTTEFYIPLDPANKDYAEYLRYTEWVAAGNDPQDFWESDI